VLNDALGQARRSLLKLAIAAGTRFVVFSQARSSVARPLFHIDEVVAQGRLHLDDWSMTVRPKKGYPSSRSPSTVGSTLTVEVRWQREVRDRVHWLT
jgi:hypothetical protein